MVDKMYGHKKILREVEEAFAEQKGGKIGVIIGSWCLIDCRRPGGSMNGGGLRCVVAWV